MRGSKAITLRVAQQAGHANTIALGGPLSFSLELEDGTGNTREIASTVIETVPGIYNSVVRGDDTTSGIFTTLRFPVHAFEADGTTIDLGDIRHVRLKFATGGLSGQGRLAVDDLELER